MTQPGSFGDIVPPGKDDRVRRERELKRRLQLLEGQMSQVLARLARLESS